MGGGFIDFLSATCRRAGAISNSPPIRRSPTTDMGAARAMLPPMDPQQSMRREEERKTPRSVRSIRN